MKTIKAIKKPTSNGKILSRDRIPNRYKKLSLERLEKIFGSHENATGN